MQVTTMRFGKTVNTGNYSSEKLEIEAIPSEGQTAEDALNEVKAFVESKLPATNNNPKPATAKPAENPTNRVTSTSPSEQPPFDVDSAPAAEPGEKPKRGRPRKKPDHIKELEYATESESLEELAERFTDLRKMADSFEVVEWEAAVSQIAGCYRKLNSVTADPDLQQQLIAAFKEERKYVDEKRCVVDGEAASAA